MAPWWLTEWWLIDDSFREGDGNWCNFPYDFFTRFLLREYIFPNSVIFQKSGQPWTVRGPSTIRTKNIGTEKSASRTGDSGPSGHRTKKQIEWSIFAFLGYFEVGLINWSISGSILNQKACGGVFCFIIDLVREGHKIDHFACERDFSVFRSIHWLKKDESLKIFQWKMSYTHDYVMIT